MSDDASNHSGWHRSLMQQLRKAEEVVDVGSAGASDKKDNPDFITVKLAHGHDSEVLDDILGYENYVILSAKIGESGELMLDITDPKLFNRFYLSV